MTNDFVFALLLLVCLVMTSACSTVSPVPHFGAEKLAGSKLEFLEGQCSIDSNSMLYCKNDVGTYHFVVTGTSKMVKPEQRRPASRFEKPPIDNRVCSSACTVSLPNTLVYRGMALVIDVEDIKVLQLERSIASEEEPGIFGFH